MAIDVLALLNEYATTMDHVCQQENADDLREASAAVAQLVDRAEAIANRFAWSAVSCDCSESANYLNKLLIDLRTALFRIGGAP